MVLDGTKLSIFDIEPREGTVRPERFIYQTFKPEDLLELLLSSFVIDVFAFRLGEASGRV